MCIPTGCYQRFSSGLDIAWSRSGGLHTVWTRGAIGQSLYKTYGGYADFGYPSSDETCGLPNGGCSQNFGGQRMLWSPSTGAFSVWTPGAIGNMYALGGAERGLGYPLTMETCGQPAQGCYQNYQHGSVVYSPATGAHISGGAIRAEWGTHGYQSGGYGYPLQNEVCGQRGGGCYQLYQGGTIFWSPTTGAVGVHGAINAKYAQLGSHTGYLGWPLGPEYCAKGQCIERFQGGYISWGTGVGLVDYGHTECSSLNDGWGKESGAGAARVTFAIADSYGQSRVKILNCKKIAGTYVTDWITSGTVGQSGFKPPGVPSGPTRNLFSPTGSYTVTEAFGLGNPGTSLPYRTLNPNSRWGGNPWTATYNTYFESSSWDGYDENMWFFATRPQHDYRQGAVINYNRPPTSAIAQDYGFAIFLHENPVPTAGCLAMDEWHVVDWLKKATSGDRIIMGIRADLFR